MNAIFTSTVDQDFFNLVSTSFVEYSKKCKCDLIIRQSQHLKNYTINVKASFERYDMYNLLKIYDRVLWLDSDIYISKQSENIFDIVPEDELGVFYEVDSIKKTNDCINRMVETFQMKTKLSKYFNSGVLVTSKCHSEMFNMSKVEEFFNNPNIKGCQNSDQDYLNLYTHRENVKVYSLPRQYNYMINDRGFVKSDNPKFVHFAGTLDMKKMYIQQFIKGNPNF